MASTTPTKALAIVGGVLLAFGIVLAVKTGALVFVKPFPRADAIGLLQTMFVVALFLERSLEVFINAWRGEGEAVAEEKLRAAKRGLAAATLAAGKPLAPADPQLQTLDAAEAAWAVYKAATKRIALCAAVVAGVLIAAAGLRSFEVFVTPRTPQGTWDTIAGALYNILNVLITGGLLGGGSDLIHKILKILTDFLDTTSKLIQRRAPQP
jgi:hypothetical protein